jgi:hypothetical protein
MRGPTSSPSPNPQARRSLFTSPARGSPARSRPMSGEVTRPVVVGQSPQDLLNDIVQSTNSELFARRIRFPLETETGKILQDAAEANSGSTAASTEDERIPSTSKTDESDEEHRGDTHREVSLSHVITNVVVLQEFILELVAVMQVRASMFDEVKFA